jgi:hypothetical protein
VSRREQPDGFVGPEFRFRFRDLLVLLELLG